jgi:hypothetical protein
MRRGDEGRGWPGSGHGYGRSNSAPSLRESTEEQLRGEIRRLRALLGQAEERRRQHEFELARLRNELDRFAPARACCFTVFTSGPLSWLWQIGWLTGVR